MIWAGISMNGKTRPVVVNGNLNSIRYRDEILAPVVIPYLQNLGPNAIFQDENARSHRARIVNDFLQQHGVTRMDWPSRSPDLNPIENLWDQLGRAVRDRVTNRTTLVQLRQIVADEWNALPQNRVRAIISSMRRRCEATVDALGGSSRY